MATVREGHCEILTLDTMQNERRDESVERRLKTMDRQYFRLIVVGWKDLKKVCFCNAEIEVEMLSSSDTQIEDPASFASVQVAREHAANLNAAEEEKDPDQKIGFTVAVWRWKNRPAQSEEV